MEPRFLLDRNLGKLAKWLRILGYDTVYDDGSSDIDFVDRAHKELRIAVVRKRNMVDLSRRIQLLVLTQDRLPAQLQEVLNKLKLDPDRAKRLTRCLICNVLLAPVSKKDLPPWVPDYVRDKYTDFKMCPSCGRIYWPGTHVENIEVFLKSHNRWDRPVTS